MLNNSTKKITCILCGATDYKKIGEKNSFQVVLCNCGLIYINPQPTPEITEQIYNKQYFSGGNNFGYQGISYLGKENEKWFKYIPTRSLKKIEKYSKRKGELLCQRE